RDLRVAGPDLLPGDDQVIAVDDRARLQARQVGARVRLRETLAPDDVAAEDARQAVRLLGLAAAGDQGRARVAQADERGRDLGRAGARVLLVPDELLHERRAPAAELLRPRHAGPARVEQPSLPRERELAT